MHSLSGHVSHILACPDAHVTTSGSSGNCHPSVLVDSCAEHSPFHSRLQLFVIYVFYAKGEGSELNPFHALTRAIVDADGAVLLFYT